MGYPDARLYVDLRGTDERPADPAEVLGRFLIALGLPQRLIPAGLEERAARFRAMMFRRHALVVLDNAADEAQVRPLLPASPRCLVLVTSRNVLAGLETPHRLLLDVLMPRDAVALLAEIVGERAAAEPEAMAEVAELCGYLPLALRIAANRLASRPSWSVAFLAERLRDETRPPAGAAGRGPAGAGGFRDVVRAGEPGRAAAVPAAVAGPRAGLRQRAGGRTRRDRRRHRGRGAGGAGRRQPDPARGPVRPLPAARPDASVRGRDAPRRGRRGIPEHGSGPDGGVAAPDGGPGRECVLPGDRQPRRRAGPADGGSHGRIGMA